MMDLSHLVFLELLCEIFRYGFNIEKFVVKSEVLNSLMSWLFIFPSENTFYVLITFRDAGKIVES
jgi:hypothetical protein